MAPRLRPASYEVLNFQKENSKPIWSTRKPWEPVWPACFWIMGIGLRSVRPRLTAITDRTAHASFSQKTSDIFQKTANTFANNVRNVCCRWFETLKIVPKRFTTLHYNSSDLPTRSMIGANSVRMSGCNPSSDIHLPIVDRPRA